MLFRRRLNPLWTILGKCLGGDRPVWLTASGVAGCVIACRMAGLLQPLEWQAYDHAMRLRPQVAEDNRVVIVGIDEADLRKIGKWPIPDAQMAKLIQTLKTYQPRAIGLDIYRDLAVEPGHADLLRVYQTTPNLVGIEQIPDKTGPGVPPPAFLSGQKRVGFNNAIVDADGVVRRGLLYWTVDRQVHESFALRLARLYLQAQGIKPSAAANSSDLQLGKTTFPRFAGTDGSYAGVDDAGYQFLANFRGPANTLRIVSMRDVLAGRVSPAVFRDRLVLIGSTAVSLKDFFDTSYTRPVIGSALSPPISGVELQGHLVSQIVSAALDGQRLIQVWPDPVEWIWIVAWSSLGAVVSWRLRSPLKATSAMVGAGLGLIGIGYGGLIGLGIWIPLVPAAIATVGSAALITLQIAQQQEELKRSKEFLSTVIDTIPDPVFVQDHQHRWIMLNEAYCQFSGYSRRELLAHVDGTLLSPRETDPGLLQHPFEAAALGGQAPGIDANGVDQFQESEEDFTDRFGGLHRIATKRSLHRDAAGNVFLVGVIRDITERKRMEEELRRSNQELQLSALRLSHLAHHDPLTGLPNRKLFYERLSQALARADEHRSLVAVMFLDLDGFKRINDTLGHDIGDLLLQAVGKRMTGCLRGSDTVSRLGGDEFTVILAGIPTPEVAEKVAEKILATLSIPFALKDHSIAITTSIGIGLYPSHSNSLDTVVKGADLAMYESKQAGKNRFTFYRPLAGVCR
jgi:diguanylate cyclase (GGDEF)-like protein